MATYHEPSGKEPRIPSWALAIIVLLTLALIILICLSITYGVMSAKDQEENAGRSEEWTSLEKKLEEIREIAARKAEQMTKEETERVLMEYQITPEKKQRLKHIAQMFQKSMDTSVDPCDNFYQFACGNYIKGKVGPYSMFREMYETLSGRIWEALEYVNEKNVDEKLRKVYSYLEKLAAECKEPFRPEEVGLLMADVARIIQEIGDSPILKPEISEVNPFVSAMKLLKLTGVKTLLDVKRDRDIFNPQQTALYVDLSLNFLKPDLEGTNSYKLNILKEGNITEDSIQKFHEECRKLKKDEDDLSNTISSTSYGLGVKKLTGEEDISIGFEEAQSKAQNVVTALLAQSTTKKLEKSRIFWNFEWPEKYPDNLDAEGLEEFDNLVSMHWQTIQSGIVEKFLTVLLKSLESKKRFCMNSIKPALNYALLHLLVNKYDYGGYKLVDLRLMIETIRIMFTASLFQTDWLDPITKNKALNKLNYVIPRMLAPPLVYNNDSMKEYFQDLPELKGNETLMETFEAVNTMYVEKQFQELGSPSKTIYESFMEENALDINAFYSQLDNSINVLIGVIQPPNLDWNDPKFFLYAGPGYVIGHEFTHGFDTVGSQFDLTGKYKQWMSDETTKKFFHKAECFFDQYSKFCYADIKDNTTTCLNGGLTSGETMADDGGIRLAYQAYNFELFLANAFGVSFAHEAKLMPGFEDYTLDQLFFHSFANKMCSANEQPRFDDPHPPNSARVIGTLRNNLVFSRAFNCSSGSGMNPKNKCQVWS